MVEHQLRGSKDEVERCLSEYDGLFRTIQRLSEQLEAQTTANSAIQARIKSLDANRSKFDISLRDFGSFLAFPPELLSANLYGQDENANKKQTAEAAMVKLREVEKETRKTVKLKALAQVSLKRENVRDGMCGGT